MYYLGALYTTANFVVREKIAAGKERVKRVFTEEVGGTEFIAIILILVVVIALGIVFKDNIMTMANNLWSKVGKGGSTDGSSVTGNMGTVSDPFSAQ